MMHNLDDTFFWRKGSSDHYWWSRYHEYDIDVWLERQYLWEIVHRSTGEKWTGLVRVSSQPRHEARRVW